MGGTRYQGAIIRDHHILLLKQAEHASGRKLLADPGRHRTKQRSDQKERDGMTWMARSRLSRYAC